MPVDQIDLRLIRLLLAQGRKSWTELAEAVGLSPPAVAARVRNLEEAGVIQGYAAEVNSRALGVTLTAFVSVTLEHPRYRETFLKLVNELAQIQECHHVAGDADYLLKIRCEDTTELEKIITDTLKGSGGVSQTRTTIVLSTVVDSNRLRLPGD